MRRQDSLGVNWADGSIYWTPFYTILPPNGPSCYAVMTSRSRHPGGVTLLFVGGAVTFMSEDVWAGNPAATMPATPRETSPYGVWGALGTRAGGEAILMP